MTKTEFVLQQPADLSPLEVVRRAKGAGMKLSTATVYAARKLPPTRTSAMMESLAELSKFSMPPDQLEQQFIKTAAELGLIRATELLDELRRTLLS